MFVYVPAATPARDEAFAANVPVNPKPAAEVTYHSTDPPAEPIKLVKSPAGKLGDPILNNPPPVTAPPAVVPKLRPVNEPQSNVDPVLRPSVPHERLFASTVIE